MDCDVRESVIFRLNSLRHLVVRCADIANIPPEVNLCLQRVVSIVSDDSQFRSQDRYKAGRVFTQDRGRPSYSISKEQLELFIEFGFHTSEMATMLGVSGQSKEDYLITASQSLRVMLIFRMMCWITMLWMLPETT